MRVFHLWCALVAAGLLAAPAALAQKLPPTLLGTWQVRNVGFATSTALPDSVLARLDDPEVAGLNQEIFSGESLLRVTFKADSTYDFTIMRGGTTVRFETGTYRVRKGRLLADSPGSADGSSFHDQQVQQLARRRLTLAFPAGPALPGVTEEVEYFRVGPYPAQAGVGER